MAKIVYDVGTSETLSPIRQLWRDFLKMIQNAAWSLVKAASFSYDKRNLKRSFDDSFPKSLHT